MQEVMNLEEVATYLKVSERTILREIKEGKIKAFRVGGRSLRFRREDVEEYIRKQEVRPEDVQPESKSEEHAEDAA